MSLQNNNAENDRVIANNLRKQLGILQQNDQYLTNPQLAQNRALEILIEARLETAVQDLIEIKKHEKEKQEEEDYITTTRENLVLKENLFKEQHKEQIHDALAPGNYDHAKLIRVTTLLNDDAAYAKSSGLGHSSLPNEQLMCIGGKCLDPNVLKMMDKDPAQFASSIKLAESSDLVRQYYSKFLYQMPLTPEQATEISKNDPAKVAEAEEFYKKRAAENGTPLKHEFHLNEYFKDMSLADRNAIREILKNPDKCMMANACSLKDHETRQKFGPLLKGYEEWFKDKYHDSPVPWKESEYDAEGNKLTKSSEKLASPTLAPPILRVDGITIPNPSLQPLTKTDGNKTIILVPSNYTSEQNDQIMAKALAELKAKGNTDKVEVQIVQKANDIELQQLTADKLAKTVQDNSAAKNQAAPEKPPAGVAPQQLVKANMPDSQTVLISQ